MFKEVLEVKEIKEVKATEWLAKATDKISKKDINIDEPLVNVKKNNQESK